MKTSRQGDHEPKRDAADPGEKRVVRLDPNDASGPCAIMMDETSLVQKIATNSVGDDVIDPAAAAMGDAIRYTYRAPASEYAAATNRVVGALEDSGLQPLKWKNTGNDAVYNGISQHLGRHTGQKFEVQFHTSESFATKDHVLHALSKESR